VVSLLACASLPGGERTPALASRVVAVNGHRNTKQNAPDQCLGGALGQTPEVRASFDGDRTHSTMRPLRCQKGKAGIRCWVLGVGLRTLFPNTQYLTPNTRLFYFAGAAGAKAPILNILVPQVIHEPVTAGLPFFIRVSVGFAISFIALHLKQYPSNVILLVSDGLLAA